MDAVSPNMINGVPQGHMLSPLLFSLRTIEFTHMDPICSNLSSMARRACSQFLNQDQLKFAMWTENRKEWWEKKHLRFLYLYVILSHNFSIIGVFKEF